MVKYILIFHANLNYSHLPPEKRDFVCKESYGRIADLFMKDFPQTKWCFEASGFTLDYIAKNTPQVLDKLKGAFQTNCEFVGSPYAHSILTNFPYEDGCKALKFALEAYQKHLGFTPKSAWNPEGAWTKNIPKMYKEAGYESLIVDWDSYMRTKGMDDWKNTDDLLEGKRCFVALDDRDKKLLHYPVKVIPGLKGVARTDRVSVFTLRYFLGEVELEKLLEVVDYYSPSEGYLTIYAEDAEYVGTTAWYYLKYKGIYRLFEDNPGSLCRLARLIESLEKRGELSTISEVLEKIPTINESIEIKDGLAWHHQEARFWAETPPALELDKECDEDRKLIRQAEDKAKTDDQKEHIKKAWWYLVQAENSDGRWPPPPKNPADFNIKFCKDMLKKAKGEIYPYL